MRSSRRRPRLAALVALVSLVALAVSTVPAASATPTPIPSPSPTAPAGTSQLSGRVTDENGVPVAGARVNAYGSGSGVTTTESSGEWTLGGLRAGGYRVDVTPPAGSNLVGEYWDDAGSYLTATSVRVAEGESVTGLDSQLAEAAVLRGRITDASGTPVALATVSVDRTDIMGASNIGTSTWADGTYEIRPLAAGTYRLTVVPPTGSGLSTTYWAGVADVAAATPITLRAGQVLEGVDVTPLPGQGLAGRVTLPAGVPMSEVQVGVRLLQPGGWSIAVAGTTPDADGTYRFDDLVSGSYTVRVEHIDWNGPIVPEYYRDATAEERATPVEVTAGTVVTGIDLTPVLAGRITGVLTAPPGGSVEGVEVTLVPRSGQVGTWGFWTVGQNGSFLVGRLPAGSYSVRFTSPDGSVQYFKAPGGTTRDLHGASKVKVRQGEAVEIAARLRGGSRP